MNIQQWAVFFVALLSFDYATATYFGSYKDVGKGYDDEGAGYYGWSRGCRCNRDLEKRLDNTLDSIRSHVDESYYLTDYSLEEYEMKDGQVTGLHKFERKGPYHCSLTKDYARIIFRIGFLRLLVHYKLSIIEDILTGFMGGFGSLISSLIGSVTNLALRIILPDIYVSIVLIQYFGDSRGIILEGFYTSHISRISLQNKELRKHEKSVGPYFRPVMDDKIREVCQKKLSGHFSSSFKKVTVKREMFYHESSSSTYEHTDDEYEGKRGSSKHVHHSENDDSSASGKYKYSYNEEQEDDDDSSDE